MNSGQISSEDASISLRPAWQAALIVLAVLFAVSEIVYLVLGGIAKACLVEGAACGALGMDISNALFVNATDVSGVPVFSNIFAIGLPGFNNLFYLFISGLGIDGMDQLLSTVAASVIIGFLVLWGCFAASARRGVMMRLLLAIVFALGWWVLYNNTEASVYKTDFLTLAFMRYLEIPVGAISLFVASFLVLPRH